MESWQGSCSISPDRLLSNALISNGFSPRILIAGGGTGGHVYPAVAIADAIGGINREAVVEFAGSRTGIEWRLVPESGYSIHHISVQGLQRRLTLKNLTLPFVVAKGLKEARDLIRHFDADVVLGTGGYVALPLLLAARYLHRRTAIQEQNAFMGLTNRIVSRFADQIHIAFDEAAPKSKGSNTRITGNPVRQNLAESHKQEALDYFEFSEVRQIVFMTGGSIGSQAMNEVMAAIVRSLLAKRGIGVIWQTGERYFERFQTSVPDHPRLRLKAYVDRMNMAYAAADLVICRSGASTCSELMLTGKPAILIPSPNVAEDHQTKNALSLVSAGAATLLEESRMHRELLDLIRDLLGDRDRLDSMSANALKLAKPNAAREIAEDILGLARTRIR